MGQRQEERKKEGSRKRKREEGELRFCVLQKEKSCLLISINIYFFISYA